MMGLNQAEGVTILREVTEAMLQTHSEVTHLFFMVSIIILIKQNIIIRKLWKLMELTQTTFAIMDSSSGAVIY